MAATNSPLTVGIHHCLWRQGFSSVFFQKCSNGFQRNVLDESELNGLPGQHAQRPMVVPVGDRAARDGDEVGGLRTTQGLTVADLALVAHHRIDSAFFEPSLDCHNRVATHIKGAADLG